MTLSRSQVGQGCYLLGTVAVSGNPGAMAFGGDVARTGTLALGLLLLVLSCASLSSVSKDEVLLVFLVCSPLPLIELLVRVQHQTALYDNPLAFRLICYLYYIAGALIALSLRKVDAASITFLVVSIVVACVLSLCYLVSLSAIQISAGRQTIDESLNPIGIAYSFGLVVVTAFSILLSATANLVKLLSLAAMIFGMACVFFTGSRGAILSLFITIGFYFTFRMRFASKLFTCTALTTGLKIICGVVVLILIGLFFRETLESQLEFVENRFTQAWKAGYDASMEGRAQIRGDYFDHLDEWWLFGYYRYDGAYPHNIFLEAWIRFGLFGFVICGGVVVAILKLLSMSRLSPRAILSVITLQGLFTFINAQTSLSLEFQRTLWGACGTGITLLLIGTLNKRAAHDMLRVLLVEPGKTGHRPVILRYVCKVLSSHSVRYTVETSPELTQNPAAIQETAARSNCDLVHLLTFDNVFKQWAWKGRPRANIIPVVGTYYLYSNFSHPLRGLIADLMLRGAGVSTVLVSDEYLESRLLPPWRRKRLMFLPDPWDPDEFAVLPKASAREALELPPNFPIVLMFGELSRRKGVDTMLDALAKLPASAQVQGLFAGRMCPEVRARYDKQITELRARGRLLLREGFVPEQDVAAYFCAADAVACPYPISFSVSSNTATRAAAAGLPIIVSSHGFLGHIASERRIGLRFPTGDIRRLADCLMQLEQSAGTQFLAEMGERARSLAAKRTLEHFGDALISAYSSVLPKAPVAIAQEKAVSSPF